ncbi:hypothetical protein [Amycolatopsis sp. H20-H5]|uniref:hypothetical protein n=1 Tax=Amycolatopsis sp. H20-H5 TaxID=3046309 RepID=UPI002DC06393|nr:hypothetical protein [Amycolatopsis sp. H20-H5]MEC3974099.1 hypothetical protein [Amycolatopsis sp. H20-H5]
MAENTLGVAQRAALLALMLEGQEVSNPELKDKRNFTITGPVRRALNEQKLVTSRLHGRSYRHALTGLGWKRCVEEFSATPPAGSRLLDRGLHEALAAFAAFVLRQGFEIADVFKVTAPLPPDLEGRIRAAYEELAERPKAWVSLTDLRPLLDGSPRVEVDEVLLRLDGTPEVTIIPEANRKTLTAKDHAAAITIGGEQNHLISMDGS